VILIDEARKHTLVTSAQRFDRAQIVEGRDLRGS
jgi:hypothetical protein